MDADTSTATTARRRSKRAKTRRNSGGKPLTIDDETLLANRECLIGFLSNAWGDIGWLLRSVRTAEDVRRALSSVTITTSQERDLLMPFVRETKTGVSRAALSATRTALKRVRARENDLHFEGTTHRAERLTERMRESRQAVAIAARTSDRHRSRIEEEHRQRVTSLATFTKDRKAREKQRTALERQLTDQEASFAQQELCVFLRKRKYAHTPYGLARAMAGLPYIGVWQSYRRFDKLRKRPTVWPTIQWRIFSVIVAASRRRRGRSTARFLDSVRERVQAIRIKKRKGKPDYHAIAVRSYFCDNWRYVVQAAEQASNEATYPANFPYVVLAILVKRVAEAATSPTERVLASVERLSLDSPSR